jgi:hypothetical protein
MRRNLIFVALAIGVTSLVAWACLRSTSTQSTVTRQPKDAVGPAGGVRFVANNIAAEQVEFITFSGPAYRTRKLSTVFWMPYVVLLFGRVVCLTETKIVL